MLIETERTPNPDTLKFIPDRDVTGNGTAYFPDRDSAGSSPLAQALFSLEEVSAVFLGPDFLSVTKGAATWDDVRPKALSVIMEHFMTGQPALIADFGDNGGAGNGTDTSAYDDADADPEVVNQIRTIIDEKVRPAVARDGGDIVYQGFRDGVVYLHMQGACAGCPSSTMTLKHGIENLLQHYLPEVLEVRQV